MQRDWNRIIDVVIGVLIAFVIVGVVAAGIFLFALIVWSSRQ